MSDPNPNTVNAVRQIMIMAGGWEPECGEDVAIAVALEAGEIPGYGQECTCFAGTTDGGVTVDPDWDPMCDVHGGLQTRIRQLEREVAEAKSNPH